MNRYEKLMMLILVLAIGIFLGYFWRIHHEFKNFQKWHENWRKEFMTEFWDEVSNGKTFIMEKHIEVIPRKDGAVTIRFKNLK